jgi:hypothetical protein
VQLLDPTPVPLRKAPRDAETWITSASSSWLVRVDNLSGIPDWLSDTLCRAVTGDGDMRRKVYTDCDLAVFAFRRCVILSSIDLGALRGDLASRLLVIDLDRISDRARRREEQLTREWEQAQPRILGALLDFAAGVAGVLPSVRLETVPRMADLAQILAAVDQLMGTDGYVRYVGRGVRLTEESLQADPFVMALALVLAGERTATSAELLAEAARVYEGQHPPKGWPDSSRAVTALLKRQDRSCAAPGGPPTNSNPEGATHTTRWRIARPEMARKGLPSVPRLPHPSSPAGVTGETGDEYGASQDDEPRDGVTDARPVETQPEQEAADDNWHLHLVEPNPPDHEDTA